MTSAHALASKVAVESLARLGDPAAVMGEAIAAAEGKGGPFAAAAAAAPGDLSWLGAAREALLAPSERRAAGAFYTPAPLVRWLIGRALGPILERARSAEEVAALRVADPAMGAGVFLVEAGRALASRLRALGDGAPEARAAACLMGLDVDPVSAAVARATVALALGVGVERLGALRAGDALALPPEPVADVIVGNPPFEVVLGKDAHGDDGARRSLAATLRKRFTAQSRELDLARVFLELSLDLVRPGGALGLVLPASVLGDRSAALLRERLFDRCGAVDVLELSERARAFPVAAQAVALVVAHQGPSARGLRVRARLHAVDAVADAQLFPVAAAALRSTGRRVPLLTQDGEGALLEKLARLPTLVKSGLVRSLHEGEIHLTRFKPALRDADGPGRLRLARGRDLAPWTVAPSSWLEASRAPSPERVAWPQVANRDLARRLKAGRLPAGVSAGNTLGVAEPAPDATPLLLALFNSRLWAWRLALTSSTNHILVSDVAALPAPDRAPQASLLALAQARERGDATVDEALDDAVSDLFDLTAAERALLRPAARTRSPGRGRPKG